MEGVLDFREAAAFGCSVRGTRCSSLVLPASCFLGGEMPSPRQAGGRTVSDKAPRGALSPAVLSLSGTPRSAGRGKEGGLPLPGEQAGQAAVRPAEGPEAGERQVWTVRLGEGRMEAAVCPPGTLLCRQQGREAPHGPLTCIDMSAQLALVGSLCQALRAALVARVL